MAALYEQSAGDGLPAATAQDSAAAWRKHWAESGTDLTFRQFLQERADHRNLSPNGSVNDLIARLDKDGE